MQGRKKKTTEMKGKPLMICLVVYSDMYFIVTFSNVPYVA